MSNGFEKLEAQLARLIEGSIARLLGSNISIASIAAQLATAMEDGLRQVDAGVQCAPDHYILMMNPAAVEEVEKSISELTSSLTSGLLEAANSLGYLLIRNPEISISADPSLDRFEIEVSAWHSTSPLEETQGYRPDSQGRLNILPKGAYLIVDGIDLYDLKQPVINIGRQQDNQIVIQSPRVSRTHAQIRSRHGRFILFDLGSKAGTKVHGIPIKQHILQPGDVITIADIDLVYGEEQGPAADETMGYSHDAPLQEP
jgi:hypothetical protein